MILTATPGDTGKAALEGFADVAQKIIVFFLEHGVSPSRKADGNADRSQHHVVGIEATLMTPKVVSRLCLPMLRRQLQQAGYAAGHSSCYRLIPQIVYYYRPIAAGKSGNRRPGACHFVSYRQLRQHLAATMRVSWTACAM